MTCGELADVNKKKKEKICKKKQGYANAACPVTCDACISITTLPPTTIVPTTAPTTTPTPICEEGKNASFKFNKEFLTCGELADENEKKKEKI